MQCKSTHNANGLTRKRKITPTKMQHNSMQMQRKPNASATQNATQTSSALNRNGMGME